MKESVTYQAILEEGEMKGMAKGLAKGMREILLRQGRRHLGVPDAATLARLEAIMDIQRLEQLSDRILDVSTWEELLAD